MSAPIILADIGGTNLRFACADKKGPVHLAKYPLVNFGTFTEAVQYYLSEQGLDKPTALFLSGTSWLEHGQVRYRRHDSETPMQVSLKEIAAACGLDDVMYLNDLEAACHALEVLIEGDLHVIQTGQGAPTNNDKIVLNFGTGLGHAYMLDGGVRKTYGGHVPLFALDTDQLDLLTWLGTNRSYGRDIIMEDVLSVRGLASLIQYTHGLSAPLSYEEALALMTQKSTEAAAARRLFSLYAGLHARYLSHLAFAYGGIYLTGGVIDDVMANNLFDTQTFCTILTGSAVSVVQESAVRMPVYYSRQTNLPLLGLNKIALCR